MPYAPKDPKTNAAGCAERKPFSPADFFSTLLGRLPNRDFRLDDDLGAIALQGRTVRRQTT